MWSLEKGSPCNPLWNSVVEMPCLLHSLSRAATSNPRSEPGANAKSRWSSEAPGIDLQFIPHPHWSNRIQSNGIPNKERLQKGWSWETTQLMAHQPTRAQPVCTGTVAFVSALRIRVALLARQSDTSQASACLCRIVKMHGTSELASAATATSPRWKRCITGFAFLSRLTAASKHFSTYLLPILLEVSTHFLAGACFLEGTEVTCHFLSHVT